jgi:hypothetical protein
MTANAFTSKGSAAGGEVYTRFVDTFDKTLVDENNNYWEQELKNWISTAKKDESIFSEIDLESWNELGERVI